MFNRCYVIRRSLRNTPIYANKIAHSGLLIEDQNGKFHLAEYMDDSKVKFYPNIDITIENKNCKDTFVFQGKLWDKQLIGKELPIGITPNNVKEVMERVTSLNNYHLLNHNCHIAQECTRVILGITDFKSLSYPANVFKAVATLAYKENNRDLTVKLLNEGIGYYNNCKLCVALVKNENGIEKAYFVKEITIDETKLYEKVSPINDSLVQLAKEIANERGLLLNINESVLSSSSPTSIIGQEIGVAKIYCNNGREYRISLVECNGEIAIKEVMPISTNFVNECLDKANKNDLLFNVNEDQIISIDNEVLTTFDFDYYDTNDYNNDNNSNDYNNKDNNNDCNFDSFSINFN
ncbi:hypothetical protein ABK040_014566 [Willaertia magna]